MIRSPGVVIASYEEVTRSRGADNKANEDALIGEFCSQWLLVYLKF